MGMRYLGVLALAVVGCAESSQDEPATQLRRLFEGAVSYYNDEQVDRAGTILPKQFPVSTPLTPAAPACIGYVPVPHHFTEADWSHPTWVALGFRTEAPSYFQFQFISEGSGMSSQFTVRAVGDLDCDGISATFDLPGVVPPSAGPGICLIYTDELE